MPDANFRPILVYVGLSNRGSSMIALINNANTLISVVVAGILITLNRNKNVSRLVTKKMLRWEVN